MIATEFILLALASFTGATPVASAHAPSTTDAKPLEIPHNAINWDGIDMAAFHNPANWKPGDATERVTSNNSVTILSGPCDQGSCPDYSAAFDLVFTFTAVPLPPDPNCPGCPPLTIFSANSDIRVNDCGQCLRQKVGSTIGTNPVGGCYDFRACGRDQSICVDPGRNRAHRIWKDNGHKTCYNMRDEFLGDCGFVKVRDVVHPVGETACNW